MNVAVILAGGSGIRLDASIPKQFYKIAGKMVIEHTIDAFEANCNIDEIAIVVNPLYITQVESLLLNNNWKKVNKILMGGDQRYKSSLSAIAAYRENEDVKLIFHDAVRPLVSQRIINDVIAALENFNAVDVAVSSTDTIIVVNNNQITNIPDRTVLMRGQTPQAFKIETINRAYELALQDPLLKTTDDCGIVKKYLPEEKIFVVDGEETNIKLTYKEDLFLLDKLFQLRSQSINHLNKLENLNGKVIVIFGASSGIGKDIAEIARCHGAKVYAFSRNLNGIDIANAEDVEKAFNIVINNESAIDFVVNTAAILSKGAIISMDSYSIREIVETNLIGMVNVTIGSYKYLKESKGHIIHFTSSSYTRGRAFYSLYSATKAGVVNFVQAISQEWESSSIRVNCLNPQRTKTPMRIKNFGIEPEESLLKSSYVAKVALEVLLSEFTGQIIDIKIN